MIVLPYQLHFQAEAFSLGLKVKLSWRLCRPTEHSSERPARGRPPGRRTSLMSDERVDTRWTLRRLLYRDDSASVSASLSG